MPKFSGSSEAKLSTCDTRLQRLFNRVIEGWDCTIIEGNRSYDQQVKNFKNGVSKTMHSAHLMIPSKAVDVAPWPLDWDNIEEFKRFAIFVKGVALGMNIEVKWGGDFKSFFDGPHWEVE